MMLTPPGIYKFLDLLYIFFAARVNVVTLIVNLNYLLILCLSLLNNFDEVVSFGFAVLIQLR